MRQLELLSNHAEDVSAANARSQTGTGNMSKRFVTKMSFSLLHKRTASIHLQFLFTSRNKGGIRSPRGCRCSSTRRGSQHKRPFKVLYMCRATPENPEELYEFTAARDDAGICDSHKSERSVRNKARRLMKTSTYQLINIEKSVTGRDIEAEPIRAKLAH